ncbi:MAG: DUF4339 domain-containing protein [Verrucomicrobiota bacterium]|nr:DUF4339 domain-containing protein [Verrucomicrobiota bacterium]
MTWYYSDGTNQLGPITTEEIKAKIASGALPLNTIVWKAGMTNWTPLNNISELIEPKNVEPPLTPGTDLVVCAECQKMFPASETIQYSHKNVCSNCKPIFFQKLQEGLVPGTAPIGPRTLEDVVRDVEAGHTDFKVGDALEHGLRVMKENMGILVLASIIYFAVSIVFGLFQYIHDVFIFLGYIFSFFVTFPLMCGFFKLHLRACRGEEIQLSQLFEGFELRKYLNILGVYVTMAVCFVPFFIGAVLISIPHNRSTALLGPIVLLIGAFASFYIIIKYFFWVPLLIMDYKMNLWSAIQLSGKGTRNHWWKTFWLCIVSYFILLLGACGCFVGMLFTAPIAVGALASVYDSIFGPNKKAEYE